MLKSEIWNRAVAEAARAYDGNLSQADCDRLARRLARIMEDGATELRAGKLSAGSVKGALKGLAQGAIAGGRIMQDSALASLAMPLFGAKHGAARSRAEAVLKGCLAAIDGEMGLPPASSAWEAIRDQVIAWGGWLRTELPGNMLLQEWKPADVFTVPAPGRYAFGTAYIYLLLLVQAGRAGVAPSESDAALLKRCLERVRDGESEAMEAQGECLRLLLKEVDAEYEGDRLSY